MCPLYNTLIASVLYKILMVLNVNRSKLFQFTYSLSVLTRHLSTSSRILAFRCEKLGVNLSSSICGVSTSRSKIFSMSNCAFSRTVSLASPNLSTTAGRTVCRYGLKSCPSRFTNSVITSIPLLDT